MSTEHAVVRLTEREASVAVHFARRFGEIGNCEAMQTSDANLLGLLGELALAKWAYGAIDVAVLHRTISLGRWVMTGAVRDGGEDLPGQAVDVKASENRHRKPLHQMHLLVPPWQLRPDTRYVLAVAEPAELADVREVSLVGWTWGSLLDAPDESFRGWHRLRASLLMPMSELELSEPYYEGLGTLRISPAGTYMSPLLDLLHVV